MSDTRTNQPTTSAPDYSGAQYIPMPAGGLHALADILYPADKDTPEAHAAHVTELFVLNQDTLRSDAAYTAGQFVRIK